MKLLNTSDKLEVLPAVLVGAVGWKLDSQLFDLFPASCAMMGFRTLKLNPDDSALLPLAVSLVDSSLIFSRASLAGLESDIDVFCSSCVVSVDTDNGTGWGPVESYLLRPYSELVPIYHRATFLPGQSY